MLGLRPDRRKIEHARLAADFAGHQFQRDIGGWLVIRAARGFRLRAPVRGDSQRHRARVLVEALLNVEGLPGAALFVFRKRERQRIAVGAHIGLARPEARDIAHDQADRTADRGVRAARDQLTCAGDAEFAHDRAVDQDKGQQAR